MRVRLVALLVAVVATGACGGGGGSSAKSPSTPTIAVTTTSTASSPLRVVQAYIDAFNRGDAHGAAPEFSTDATFSTPLGSCAPCVGQSVIEQKLNAAVAAHTQIAMNDDRVSGDTLTAHSTLTSPQFPPGVTRAVGTFTAVVRTGHITSLVQEYDRSDAQTDALFRSTGQ
jgi:hypothetical protein